MFMGTNGGGIYHSKDNGRSWVPMNSGLPAGAGSYVNLLANEDTILFAAGDGELYRAAAIDSPWTWLMAADSPLWLTGNFLSIAANESELYVGESYGGVYRSTDGGNTWSHASSGLSSGDITSLLFAGDDLYAGTANAGVCYSSDHGASWTPTASVGLTNLAVNSFAMSGTKLFCGTNGGIFVSTSKGASWTDVSSGFPKVGVTSLAVNGSDLVAGTYGYGAWKRPVDEMIASVGSNGHGFPLRFELSQNYPNPFNPSTTISYDLPQRAHVTLKIFDILGREVAVLVDEEKQAGSYSVRWNALHVASDVYFYRLEAGSFVQTKKLVLMK
jgi:ligand-binding sensor domain-containing protein